jgi:hypothetical protein
MALIDSLALAQDATFRGRVSVAAIRRAKAVAELGEFNAELARRIVMSPAKGGEIMASSIAVDETVLAAAAGDDTDALDDAIETALVAIWPLYLIGTDPEPA